MRNTPLARWSRPLLLGVALVGVAGTVTARPIAITFDPPAPDWRDVIRFTVEGVGCSPSLGPVTALVGGFQAPLSDACTGSATPAPFHVSGEIRDVPPVSLPFRVSDAEATVVAQLEVRNVAPVGLELPAVASSTDATPVTLVVRDRCVSAGWEIEPGVVTISLGDCLFEPPPVSLSTLEPPLGPLAPGHYEVRVLDQRNAGTAFGIVRGQLEVRAPARCFPAEDRLCLRDGRFEVTGTRGAFDGTTGTIHAKPLAGSDEAGTSWFFSPSNTELTVKVLDGCGVNGHWWVFISSASTVAYDVRVGDTVAGHSKVYHHAAGEAPLLVSDTDFGACP
jgi:hypothetical protein